MSEVNKKIVLLQKKIKLLQKENNKLKNLIIIDELTKLYNRRGFWQLAPSFFNDRPNNKSDKRKPSVKQNVLLFIDLDDFKHINDRYGHDKGDRVLKTFATYLKNKVRKSDLVVRWGGEEFIIILHNITFKEALAKSKKILLEINKHLFANISLTASIGIVNLQNENNITQVIKKADQLMYQAKQKGKNSICY